MAGCDTPDSSTPARGASSDPGSDSAVTATQRRSKKQHKQAGGSTRPTTHTHLCPPLRPPPSGCPLRSARRISRSTSASSCARQACGRSAPTPPMMSGLFSFSASLRCARIHWRDQVSLQAASQARAASGKRPVDGARQQACVCGGDDDDWRALAAWLSAKLHRAASMSVCAL
jgi:hypothetical protein